MDHLVLKWLLRSISKSTINAAHGILAHWHVILNYDNAIGAAMLRRPPTITQLAHDQYNATTIDAMQPR